MRFANSAINDFANKEHDPMIPTYRVGKMDFKVEGPWNTEKYFRPQWLTDKKKV